MKILNDYEWQEYLDSLPKWSRRWAIIRNAMFWAGIGVASLMMPYRGEL